MQVFETRKVVYPLFGELMTRVVESLVGEVATLLEDLPPGGQGKAELRGSAWTARNAGSLSLVKGQRSRVKRVEGLTI